MARGVGRLGRTSDAPVAGGVAEFSASKIGAYKLRLGVIDRPSRQIGTVDEPLVVTAGEVTAKK